MHARARISKKSRTWFKRLGCITAGCNLKVGVELKTAFMTVSLLCTLVPLVFVMYGSRGLRAPRVRRATDERDVIPRPADPVAEGFRRPRPATVATGDRGVCGETLTYVSIKRDAHWKRALLARFDDLVTNLRSAVDEQLNRSPVGWTENLSRARILLAAAFKPIISPDEFATMVSTFYTLADSLTDANVTFFLYGGSALGSYRHFGMIPWDDDIDIMISIKHMNRTRDSLSAIPGYTLVSNRNGQWKFHLSKLPKYFNIPHSWPFVDMFFYDENATHLWDRISAYKTEFVYPKSWVFPLQYRPFEGGFAPVPRYLQSVVNKNYRPYTCRTSYYFHKYEAMRDSQAQAEVHCSVLYQLLPFVFRQRSNQSTSHREPNQSTSLCVADALKIGDSVITTLVRPRR